MSIHYASNKSFKLKSSDRPVRNTSGGDDWAPENEGAMSLKLFPRYFDKKLDEQNKRMESTLHSDAR